MGWSHDRAAEIGKPRPRPIVINWPPIPPERCCYEAGGCDRCADPGGPQVPGPKYVLIDP